MKTKNNNTMKLLAAVLTVCMLFALLVSCASDQGKPQETTAADAEQTTAVSTTDKGDDSTSADTETADTTDTDSTTSAEETTASADLGLDVKIMVLNGTTGFGMAKLMDENTKKNTLLNYSFSVESDASNVSAALISGNVDIAALPTNAAATVYAKTKGGVQILAANTLGVLYIVTNGDQGISSLADLNGKTVYCPAQNPTFIMKYLFAKNGLDVTIDNTYAQPADLRTAVTAGKVDIAILPEPMGTIAMSQNKDLKKVVDVTAEWNRVSEKDSLVQGCIVVRTEFANQHPDAVSMFLDEYSASVSYVRENPESAGEMITANGIFAQAAVAAKAIPNCNICFMEGEVMKTAVSKYMSALFEIAPASVGGAVPGDDFYYARKK